MSNHKAVGDLVLIQTFSNLAAWLDLFLVFLVPSSVWQATSSDIAMVAALMGFPGLLVGPLFGAILDRGDVGRWLARAALLRTVASLALAIAPGLWLFGALMVVKSLARSMYGVASVVAIHRLVGPPLRTRFFADVSVLDHLVRLAAPLLAGAASLWLPLQMVFVLSALFTWICWWRLKRLRTPLKLATRVENARPEGSFSGLRSLPPGLWLTAVLSVALSMAVAVYEPHVPGWLAAEGFAASALVWLVSATAAGAVLAAVMVRTIGSRLSACNLLRAGFLIFCVALVATACLTSGPAPAPRLGALAGLWALNGFGYELWAIGAGVTLQHLCPPAWLGRVGGMFRSLQLAAVVTGPAVGAWLIATQGRGAPFLAAACGTLLMSVALLVVRPGAGYGSVPHNQG